MSEKKSLDNRGDEDFSEVKVERVRHKHRRNTHTAVLYDGPGKGISKVSSISNDFVYVNKAYVGSLNSVNDVQRIQPVQPVITGVYREQYWACSRWSFGKRLLAIGVGVILGGAIGLAVTMALKGDKPEDVIGGIFKSVPD